MEARRHARWVAFAQSQQVLLPPVFLNGGQGDCQSERNWFLRIKGVAAYAAHALALGAGDPVSFAKIHEVLDFLTIPRLPPRNCWAWRWRRELNYRVMEILDHAHTEAFALRSQPKGPPGARKGNAILFRGHDLHDL